MTRFEMYQKIQEEITKLAIDGVDWKLADTYNTLFETYWAPDDRGGFYDDTDNLL